ncbi:MAG: Xaa-Pro peptidase family protein [Syntrophomonadaceae bacterium]
MLLTPRSEIEFRISKLQQEMHMAGCRGAIILQNNDLYYFTGTVQNSQLFVPAQGQPVLAVRKSYSRAKQESPLANIVLMKSPKEFAAILSSLGQSLTSRIGLELDVLPYNRVLDLQKLFPQASWIDISPVIRAIRMIKSPYEIELIRESLRVLDQGFQDVPRVLREGMPEFELASYFESALRRAGMSGSSRMRAFNQDFTMSAICSGSSAAYSSGVEGSIGGAGLSPAYPMGASRKAILRGEPVIVDFAPIVNGYTGDQTRVFCIGEMAPKMVKAHQDALFINQEILNLLKPGVLAEEAYYLGVGLATEMGYEDNFLGYRDDRVRFIGHGVGLDTDELPVFAPGCKIPMQTGMTFALEPKFVFPEGAIGTESTYVMTEHGPENLSITPEKITYIE